MDAVAFQTRARTIDHLGRGQIADCPTAVSELWKNAYDAYARNVSLHVFDGEVPVAGIIDDGHGMGRDEFVSRWLVVGTESKTSGVEVPLADRNDLPTRERQGEKGIGRLSVAFLGPVVLILSKRRNMPFVAALLDWRIFENPYLVLEDIGIPVEEFESPSDFKSLLPGMLDLLVDNVWGKGGESERSKRLNEAWRRYSEIELSRGLTVTTAEAVANSAMTAQLTDDHLNSWPVWSDGSEHGTALFILGVHHELAVWVDPGATAEDSVVATTRNSLQETLSGFVDPYSEDLVTFDYQVVIHKGSTERVIISPENRFGLDDLRSLEHAIEGSFDERGAFRGRVRAFGQDMGEVFWSPQRPITQSRSAKVGPFDLCLGTFEQVADRSTHPPDRHQFLNDQASRYAGLAIYRDALRVMPYGRQHADFFGIEERRSTHAGREFWSYRRTFGRLAITRAQNPNLRDKAGREGLIDNQARRELRIVVVDFLKQMARRYYNAESAPYQQFLPETVSRNQAREAEQKAKKYRGKVFRETLRSKSEPLNAAVHEVQRDIQDLKLAVAAKDADLIGAFEDKVDRASSMKSDFKLPMKPESLGKIEEIYRDYRDKYNKLCQDADDLSATYNAAVNELRRLPPEEEARAAFVRHQGQLIHTLNRIVADVQGVLAGETDRVAQSAKDDRGRYFAVASPVVTDVAEGRRDLLPALEELRSLKEELQQGFELRYGIYRRILAQIAEGIDLDAAAAESGERGEELKSQVDRLHALAQLGITVEIVGHELETIEAEVERNLRAFPREIKGSEPYKRLVTAHKSLVDRLRFLSPMKLSGPRLREEITGEMIAQFLEDFFGRRIESGSVRFVATEAFRKIRFKDYVSRILPVFVNIINNSLYWVTFNDGREIRIDLVGEDVVIGDSGPGVDPEDRRYLFGLFFSRRVEGRGVGLYLCRANLAAGGHNIEYAADDAHRIMNGANFVIRFQGVTHE